VPRGIHVREHRPPFASCTASCHFGRWYENCCGRGKPVRVLAFRKTRYKMIPPGLHLINLLYMYELKFYLHFSCLIHVLLILTCLTLLLQEMEKIHSPHRVSGDLLACSINALTTTLPHEKCSSSLIIDILYILYVYNCSYSWQSTWFTSYYTSLLCLSEGTISLTH
jgi:hypothetical protein